MTANEVIDKIKAAEAPDEIRAANQAATLFLESASPEDAKLVRGVLNEQVESLLSQVEEMYEAGLRFLALNGTTYSLEDWLTPAEYARKYGLKSSNVVTNWMMRQIIPPDDMITVPELNDLKLVRNRPYKNTTVEVGG